MSAHPNGPLGYILDAHMGTTKTVTPPVADQWKYRGWDISFDMKPIPVRDFDWTATGPNYDASYEGPEDGGWVATGGHVHAATYEDLLVEIEDAIAAEEDEA